MKHREESWKYDAQHCISCLIYYVKNNKIKNTVKRQSYRPIDILLFHILAWRRRRYGINFENPTKEKRSMEKLAIKFCHINTSYKLSRRRIWSKKRSLVKRINKAGKPVNKCIMSPCHELSVILCIQNKNANARCDGFRQFSISMSPDAMFWSIFHF